MEVSGRIGLKRSFAEFQESQIEGKLYKTDADGDTVFIHEENDTNYDGDDDEYSTDYENGGNMVDRRRIMRNRANLLFLKRLEPLQNYRRDRSGRRGAIDSGQPDGDQMLEALGLSLAQTNVLRPRESSFIRVVEIERSPRSTSNANYNNSSSSAVILPMCTMYKKNEIRSPVKFA